LKIRSIGNTTDEDDFVDSDDEEELPDFVSHEVSGTTSEGGLVAEIQDAIGNLNLTLGGADEVDSEDRPILSLNDLEAQPVILDGKLASDNQNIFEKLGDFNLGMEAFTTSWFPILTSHRISSSFC
jgi:hypothetical protein